MRKKIFMFFGDSVTLGVGGTSSSWCEMGTHYLRSRYFGDSPGDILTYNLGVAGDNSDRLLRRIESELVVRLREDGDPIVFIAVGVNDSQFRPLENRFRVSTQQFGINMLRCVEIAEKFNGRVVLVTPTPVREELTRPFDAAGEREYRNDFIAPYAEDIRRLAQTKNLALLDFNASLLANPLYLTPVNSIDGLHPSDMGHHLLAGLFVDFVEGTFPGLMESEVRTDGSED